MNIAFIPARGGSKRIPKKNIRDFCGMPMIAWSIEAAKKTGLFDYVYVSTDDQEIASVAKDFGAEVPFLRPSELSNDYATTLEVITHAAKWAINEHRALSNLCCIYATAPFIQVDDLKDGLSQLNTRGCEYAFSATDFPSSIFRALRKTEKPIGVEMLFPEHIATRTQDLPVAFHDAAQFYWGNVSSWLEAKPIFSESSIPVIIPRWRVQDIDTQEDWYRAELIHNQLRELKNDKV